MSGKPVTIATLQGYRSATVDSLSKEPRFFQQLVAHILHISLILAKSLFIILCIVLSLLILIAIGSITALIYVYPFRTIFASYRLDYIELILLWLVCLSLVGLLLTLCFRLWGFYSTHFKFRIISLSFICITSLATICTTGIVVFNHFSNEYGNGRADQSLNIHSLSPGNLPKSLTVNADDNLELTYIAAGGPLRAYYAAYPGLGRPDLNIMIQHSTLSVNANQLAEAAPNCLGNLCRKIYLPIQLTIIGPSMQTIVNQNGANVMVENNNSDSLSVLARNDSSITFNTSYANSASVTAVNRSTINMQNATVLQTNVAVDSTSNVTAPTTNTLTLQLPTSCNINTNDIPLVFINSSPEQTKLNGRLVSAESLFQNNCIGDFTS